MLKGRGRQRSPLVLLSRVLRAGRRSPGGEPEPPPPPPPVFRRALPPSTTRPPSASLLLTWSRRHKSSLWGMEAAVAAAAQLARGGNSPFFRLPAPTPCLLPNSSLDNTSLTTAVMIIRSERQGWFVLIYRRGKKKKKNKNSSLNISENCIAKWKRQRVPLLFQKSKLFRTYSCASTPSLHLHYPLSPLPQAAHLENTL